MKSEWVHPDKVMWYHRLLKRIGFTDKEVKDLDAWILEKSQSLDGKKP